MFGLKIKYTNFIFMTALLFTGFGAAAAQTTEFTYQGRLTDGAVAANGNYDFAFRLYTVETGGSEIGATLIRTAVPVSNGVFTVRLDFGAQFTGTGRWLEILVKQSLAPIFTTLAPRQPVTSVPYGIRSLQATNADNATTATTATNSLNLGGIAANQFVLTGDGRLSDARNPLAGSTNYIQNTTVQQVLSAFNISGDGRLGGNLIAGGEIFGSEYNIGGSGRVLSVAGNFNLFVGLNSGFSNSSGAQNTFVGENSGNANSTGSNNSFFGTFSGEDTTSSDNSFFGSRAGNLNVGGTQNSFFGSNAGRLNLTGNSNSFFGYRAGDQNTSGFNSFFGANTGLSNTQGSNNSFFGTEAGNANTQGSSNSFFGRGAGSSNLTSNANSFFGTFAGRDTLGGFNSFFGQGAGILNFTGANNTFLGNDAGNTNTSGSNNTVIGSNADVLTGNLTNATALGANAFAAQSNSLVLGAGANVGIGTSAPQSKLQVSGGNIYITQPNSLVITSPNGACWFITVSNTGTLSTLSVTCP